MDRVRTEEMPMPWVQECALTRYLLHDGSINGKTKFHCMDIWHNVHLGVGKSWVASGVMMLQELIPESNVDLRIAEIARSYRQFCKANKIDPVLKKVDIFTFGGRGNVERNGSWNKAAVTSNWMLFLEDYCREREDLIKDDQNLRIFVSFLHQKENLFLPIYNKSESLNYPPGAPNRKQIWIMDVNGECFIFVGPSHL